MTKTKYIKLIFIYINVFKFLQNCFIKSMRSPSLILIFSFNYLCLKSLYIQVSQNQTVQRFNLFKATNSLQAI